MSINQQRIRENVASEIVEGAPVYTEDGKKLGKVAELRSGHFKVHVTLFPDYWLDMDYVVETGDRVVMHFSSSQLGAHKLRAEDIERSTETAAPSTGQVLLSEQEQREQRERMVQELAQQRRELSHAHPEGAESAPDTGGTLGKPVEEELSAMSETGADALDEQLRDRGTTETFGQQPDERRRS